MKSEPIKICDNEFGFGYAYGHIEPNTIFCTSGTVAYDCRRLYDIIFLNGFRISNVAEKYVHEHLWIS